MNPPSPDDAAATGTVAVVLAAGLGTRMRSADAQGPPPAVRPADARLRPRRLGEHRPTARAAAARSSSTRRRSRRVIDVFADRGRLRPPGRAARHRATRSGAALAVVPDEATEILVLSGDVPLVTGADLDAILEARREDDAAIALASVFAADPAELGRVVRSEFGTVERIVEAQRRRRPRSWPATRSTPGCTPSTPPGCAAGSRP